VKPFWHGFLLSLSLCLDLGIVNVALLRTSLQQGASAGLLLGLGSCIGDLFYFSLAVAGAAALLEWPLARWILWTFGTAILLWLALRMAREAIRPHDLKLAGAAVPREPASKLLATGAGLAVASPSGILWFAAVGGSVIASFGGDTGTLAIFFAGFTVSGMLWCGFVAFTASRLRAFGSRLVRAVSLVSAGLFLYFAVTVFLDGLRRLPA
jgi:L-lysine exporter family protein LysE/ArgO